MTDRELQVSLLQQFEATLDAIEKTIVPWLVSFEQRLNQKADAIVAGETMAELIQLRQDVGELREALKAPEALDGEIT